MKVRERMTRNPRVVVEHDPVEKALSLMRFLRVDRLPVVDDLAHMHVCGVLAAEDAAGQGGRVGDHARLNIPPAVAPDTDAGEVQAILRATGADSVLVTQRGRLVGIVTLQDLQPVGGAGAERTPVPEPAA